MWTETYVLGSLDFSSAHGEIAMAPRIQVPRQGCSDHSWGSGEGHVLSLGRCCWDPGVGEERKTWTRKRRQVKDNGFVGQLYSSNRIHLEEAGRQMLLLAMMQEWLALFHPFSQGGKEKQDLKQHFSNGRQTESTPVDSDNGCLTPICLPKM